MKWLVWWLPRSFRTRLVLLVLGAVLLAQALTLYAFAVYQQSQVQTAAVNLLVTSIQTVQAALGAVPEPSRGQFVQDVSHGQWQLVPRGLPRHARLQSERGLEPALVDEPLRRSLRTMAREVNRALGRGSRVAVSAGEQPYMYVSLPGETPGRRRQRGQWLQIPLDRVDPPLTHGLLAAWLASLGALLLVAVGFSWHITRPLTQLVKATDQLAAGTPQPVEPGGPTEVRQLGEKFNAMLATLAQSRKNQNTLLAGLPHDLKGPLARMALRIEMASDETLQTGLRQDLADMQRMIDQFLAYLRGQEGALGQQRPVRLDEWLQQHVADWTKLGKSVRLDDNLPQVIIMADLSGLDRMLSNLIDNALSHGEPPVDVRLTLEDGLAVVAVADAGSGIAPQDQARVLEPFERVDAARTRSGNVGLGLSIVQLIVGAHGGALEMAQGDDGRFEVRVKLPLAQTSASPLGH